MGRDYLMSTEFPSDNSDKKALKLNSSDGCTAP